MKQMKKIIIQLLIITCAMICFACGDSEDDRSQEIIKFSDFTVERSIRAQLGKSWDQNITKTDLESIKSLTISSLYAPTFAVNPDDSVFASGAKIVMYSGYIDLVDLEYLVNLEELYINTYVNKDMLVNIDSIAKCTRLKKLSIPCSEYNNFDLSIKGYKHWADIIAKLPNLEYVDLGMYLDKHMKEVILSKTDNKDITFYMGEKDEDGYSYLDSKFLSGKANIRLPFVYSISDVNEYNEAWDYSFKGYQQYEDFVYSLTMSDKHARFPALQGTEEEIIEQLSLLDEGTEDIIILLKDDKFDFSKLLRFKNLVTLTVINQNYYGEIKSDKVWNDLLGVYEYVNLEHIYYTAKATNLDNLANLQHLQVLNISGFDVDMLDISMCKNVRELSVIHSNVASKEYISELNSVKELVLSIIVNEEDGSNTNVYEQINSEVCQLFDLKYYRDQNLGTEDMTEYYANITNMSSLESLHIEYVKCKGFENILKSNTLKYLCANARVELSDDKGLSFSECENLQVLAVKSLGKYIVDIDSLVTLPNIKNILLPSGLITGKGFVNGGKEKLTADLANKVVSNPTISLFALPEEMEYNGLAFSLDYDYLKILYNNGIYDGVIQWQIRRQMHTDGLERTFDDIRTSK